MQDSTLKFLTDMINQETQGQPQTQIPVSELIRLLQAYEEAFNHFVYLQDNDLLDKALNPHIEAIKYAASTKIRRMLLINVLKLATVEEGERTLKYTREVS